MKLRMEWHEGTQYKEGWIKADDWHKRGNCLVDLKSSEMAETHSVTWRDWLPHKLNTNKKYHNKQAFFN